MKIKVFIILILLFISSPGFCTQLPAPVVEFVKTSFPEANIRFDGYIELPDGTAYLPVLPLIMEDLDKPVEITQTIPADQDFCELPDMILFSNNLALLKIIKKEGEPPTVISSTEVPLKVKLGLLPQDFVVPKGLVLPTELKVILGDLEIPLKEKTDKEGDIEFFNKPGQNKAEKQVSLKGKTSENVYSIPELAFLNNKKLYSINYKNNKLYVLNPMSARVDKTITLPSVPFDMVITPDKRYLLAAGSAVGKIFVIDTSNNEFVKSIDVGKFPSSVLCVAKNNKAYVSNRLSGTISEIDLKNMVFTREILVTGSPDKLALSDNQHFVYYNDYNTGNIFQLNLQSEETAYLFTDKNISKIGVVGSDILSLSRTENTLTVYDLKKRKILKQTTLKEKPLDLKILEKEKKIMVVCAGAGELEILDLENFDIVNSIPLKSNGFPGRVEVVESKTGDSKAVITDFDTYELSIYDINTQKIGGEIPVNNIVGSMIISDAEEGYNR